MPPCWTRADFSGAAEVRVGYTLFRGRGRAQGSLNNIGQIEPLGGRTRLARKPQAKKATARPRLQGSPAFNRPPTTRTIKSGPERLPRKSAKAAPRPAASPLAAAIQAVRAKNPTPVTEFQARADESWKPPQVLRETIAGRKRRREEPIVPVVSSMEPPAPTVHHEIRHRGATLSGLFGASACVVALLMLVLHGIVPWVTASPADAVGPGPAHTLGDGTLSRDQLEPMTADSIYAARLIDWPLAGLIWVLIFGAALFGVDEIPRMRADRHRVLQVTLLASMAFAGFLLALDGGRWIGLYIASAADDGASPIHLHLFPYLVLLIGASVLAGAGYLLARKVRHQLITRSGDEALDDVRQPLWTAVAATLGLLLLPLLPILVLDTPQGTAYVNEAELEGSQGAMAFGLTDAAGDYATARGLLWVVFYLAWGAFGLAVAERVRPHRSLHGLYIAAQALIALPLLAAIVFALLLQFALLDVAGGRTSIPLLLPATLAVLAILYLRFLRQTFLPFLRHATASLSD